MGYNLNGRQVELAITSVTGHLMGCDFDKTYRMWGSCNPSKLLDTQASTLLHASPPSLSPQQSSGACGAGSLVDLREQSHI